MAVPCIGTAEGPDVPERSRLRLALDVLRAELRGRDLPEGTWQLLWELRREVTAAEKEELATSGITGQYLIIRPLDLLSPPGPQEMAAITGAIATLARLSMIATRGEHE